jgi:hypothetical protein
LKLMLLFSDIMYMNDDADGVLFSQKGIGNID